MSGDVNLRDGTGFRLRALLRTRSLLRLTLAGALSVCVWLAIAWALTA